MKAKLAAEILEAMEEIQKNVSNITTPYLLVHGDDDRVCPIEGSHFMHDNSPSTDKTFKVCKSVDEKNQSEWLLFWSPAKCANSLLTNF